MKDYKLRSPYGLVQFWLAFENFQIALEIMWLSILKAWKISAWFAFHKSKWKWFSCTFSGGNASFSNFSWKRYPACLLKKDYKAKTTVTVLTKNSGTFKKQSVKKHFVWKLGLNFGANWTRVFFFFFCIFTTLVTFIKKNFPRVELNRVKIVPKLFM